MKNNEIVGIRYVGKKDSQEDTVCKTGAVWAPGQVHNFAGVLASALLVHTDSFERAPVSIDGGTYLSSGKQNQSQVPDVAAYVNLSVMGTDQLVHFARRELDRVVSAEGKSEADVRREVHALMANHNLDLEAARIGAEQDADGRIPYTYMATREEVEALQSGLVVLAIVPAEVADTPKPDAPPEEDNANGGTAGIDQPKQTEEATPTLSELLEKLEKHDLLEFAKQEGVSVSNAMTAKTLRARIFAELSGRSKTE